jgi:hypothetical protein
MSQVLHSLALLGSTILHSAQLIPLGPIFLNLAPKILTYICSVLHFLWSRVLGTALLGSQAAWLQRHEQLGFVFQPEPSHMAQVL